MPGGFTFNSAQHAALWRFVERKLGTDGAVDSGSGGFNLTATGAPKTRRGTTGVAAYVGGTGTTDGFVLNPIPSGLFTVLQQGELGLSFAINCQSFSSNFGIIFMGTDSTTGRSFVVYYTQSGGTDWGTLHVGWATDASGSAGGVDQAFSYQMPLFVPTVIHVVRRVDAGHAGKYQAELYVDDAPSARQVISNLDGPYNGYTAPNFGLGLGNRPAPATPTATAINAYLGEVLLWKIAPTGVQLAAQAAGVVPNNPSVSLAPSGLRLPVGGVSVPMSSGSPGGSAGDSLAMFGRPPNLSESADEPASNPMVFTGSSANISVVGSAAGLLGRRFNGTATQYYAITSAQWNALMASKHTLDIAIRCPTTPGVEANPLQWRDTLISASAFYYLSLETNGDVVMHKFIGGVTTALLTLSGIFASNNPDLMHLKFVYDPVAQTLTGYVVDIDQFPGGVPLQVAQATGVTLPFDGRVMAGNTIGGQSAWTAFAFGSLTGGAEPVIELYAPTVRPGVWLDGYGAGTGAPVAFTAAYSAGAVNVTWSRAVINSADLTNPANYTVTQPGGMPAVSVTGVAVVSPTQVALTVSGDVRRGGSYSVAVAAKTARGEDDGGGNLASSASFTITAVAFVVLSATPLPPYPSTALRVVFSKPVLMDATTHGALNTGNYSITWAGGTLAISAATNVAPDQVQLTTAADLAGVAYQLVPNAALHDADGNSIT